MGEGQGWQAKQDPWREDGYKNVKATECLYASASYNLIDEVKEMETKIKQEIIYEILSF